MHQGAFMGANWTVRRKLSVAAHPRRGYQPHGAQWNVQVVRGKVTTRCLWNACKALTLGLLLLLLGCAMATVGYYADQLSEAQEVRGNHTVRVKNESRGFHLNNLSYAGPIVMGVGGFIVVAACVMTFEARDSAAKVVPARFKFNNTTIKSSPVSNKQCSQRSDSRRSTSCQTKWDNQMGLFRVSSNKTGSGGRGEAGGTSPCGSEVMNRRALTAAFVQFSRALQNRQPSSESASSRLSVQPIASAISKSPSAPNLSADSGPLPHLQIQTPMKPQNINPSPKSRTRVSRNSLHPTGGGCAFLSPYLLQRQALSMDNPAYGECGCYSPPPLLRRQPSGRSTRSGGNMSTGSRESLELGASAGASCSHHGSQASMAMDLHIPNDCPVTLKVRDQSRKSETARRHLFVRQKPVEEDLNESIPCSNVEHRRESHSCSPRLGGICARTNTEDSRGPHPRSRASTGESRYPRQPPIRRGSVSYSRSNTEEPKFPHPRSRSNTGESLRSYQRRESCAPHLKPHYTRSSTEDHSKKSSYTSLQHNRSRRSSTSEFNIRKQREPNSALFFSKPNTATTEEYKRLHYPRHSPSTSPYSISRSNTDDSSTAHRRDDVLQDIEMTIVGSKPDEEDSSLHELLRFTELERQKQNKTGKTTDEHSGSDKQKIKTLQSSNDSQLKFGNGATFSDVKKRASDLDLVIEIDNGESTHI